MTIDRQSLSSSQLHWNHYTSTMSYTAARAAASGLRRSRHVHNGALLSKSAYNRPDLAAFTTTAVNSAGPSTPVQKQPISSEPYTMIGKPQYPPPANPYEPDEKPRQIPRYSATTKAIVLAVGRLLGFNSAPSVAIRETGRMMTGIVDALERDREFWYGRELRPASETKHSWT